MEETMIYAPVLIPTLCRSDHFIRCIESLKNNTWAKYTDIYVAVDYPSKESHWKGYKEICDYLDGDFNEFASFNIIKRTENYGSSRNMLELRNYVFQKHDRFIRTDDDIEFSPNFIEYMDKCLMKYEKDPNIIGVSGYSYPIKWVTSDNANLFKCNFICPMWGTGFWKDKYLAFEDLLKKQRFLKNNFRTSVVNHSIKRVTDFLYFNYVNGCLNWYEKSLIDTTSDIALGIYLAITNQFIIMPTLSKTRNWGYDGSGVFCQKIDFEDTKEVNSRNYNYSTQYIDQSTEFDVLEDELNNSEANKGLMDQFDSMSKKQLLKSNIKTSLYMFLGEKNYIKVVSFFRRR